MLEDQKVTFGMFLKWHRHPVSIHCYCKMQGKDEHTSICFFLTMLAFQPEQSL